MDTEKMELDNSATSIVNGTDHTMGDIEPVKDIPAPIAETPDVAMKSESDIEAEAGAPAVTSGLEALLGGLDDPTPAPAPAPTIVEDIAPKIEQTPALKNETEAALSTANEPTVAQSAAVTAESTEISADLSVVASLIQEPIDSSTAQTTQPANDSTAGPGAAAEEEHPEWEVDSSPIESSSDDSSSDDSSSEESDEGENGYKLLSPEEQARILMEGDGGSDDEGGAKGAKGSGAQLRTKNEVAEVVIPKPDIIITISMPIEVLGKVEMIVENTVLIKAQTTGEYRVLESGSVLCLEDRTVIGVVSETIGRVEQPFYSVLFTNAGEIAEAGLSSGVQIFYSTQHSTYVFTQALRSIKGSDASNLHDEEVGDEEMEFSDDEAEMEHKRRVKQQRAERRGGKMQQNGNSGRGGHGHGHGHAAQQRHAPYDATKGISYDEADDDGPYKPLARPAGYADSVGRSEPPQEGAYQGGMNGNSNNHNRDQFRGRGRGDRGRGRGDRGRGRGGYQDRRGGGDGYSQPPQGRPNHAHPSQSPSSYSPQQFQAPANGFTQSPQTSQSPVIPSSGYANAEYSPRQPQLPAWSQFPPPPPFQQQPFPLPFPNMQNGWPMPNMPNMPNMPLPPGGAFINPAFFNNAQNAQNPQNSNANQWNNQGQNQGSQRGQGRGGSS
ncbi:Gar1/Naf1 RNA binding region-domain-containing protein [Halenospora varia]|nr:Gar1/Naf1 RNA binding region-domain-containing protein [Halenospora varia]